MQKKLFQTFLITAMLTPCGVLSMEGAGKALKVAAPIADFGVGQGEVGLDSAVNEYLSRPRSQRTEPLFAPLPPGYVGEDKAETPGVYLQEPAPEEM